MTPTTPTTIDHHVVQQLCSKENGVNCLSRSLLTPILVQQARKLRISTHGTFSKTLCTICLFSSLLHKNWSIYL